MLVLVVVLVAAASVNGRHFPPLSAPTFRRDSVEALPTRGALRSSLVEHVFGTRRLPLREAVESPPLLAR